jgi:hypothetical protein
LGIRVTVGHTGLLLNDMYWVTIICKRPNDRRGNSSNVSHSQAPQEVVNWAMAGRGAQIVDAMSSNLNGRRKKKG